MKRKITTRFSRGAINPALAASGNAEVLHQGARLIRNFIPLEDGGIIKRPGTRVLNQFSSTPTRIINIEFGGTQYLMALFACKKDEQGNITTPSSMRLYAFQNETLVRIRPNGNDNPLEPRFTEADFTNGNINDQGKLKQDRIRLISRQNVRGEYPIRLYTSNWDESRLASIAQTQGSTIKLSDLENPSIRDHYFRGNPVFKTTMNNNELIVSNTNYIDANNETINYLSKERVIDAFPAHAFPALPESVKLPFAQSSLSLSGHQLFENLQEGNAIRDDDIDILKRMVVFSIPLTAQDDIGIAQSSNNADIQNWINEIEFSNDFIRWFSPETDLPADNPANRKVLIARYTNDTTYTKQTTYSAIHTRDEKQTTTTHVINTMIGSVPSGVHIVCVLPYGVSLFANTLYVRVRRNPTTITSNDHITRWAYFEFTQTDSNVWTISSNNKISGHAIKELPYFAPGSVQQHIVKGSSHPYTVEGSPVLYNEDNLFPDNEYEIKTEQTITKEAVIKPVRAGRIGTEFVPDPDNPGHVHRINIYSYEDRVVEEEVVETRVLAVPVKNNTREANKGHGIAVHKFNDRLGCFSICIDKFNPIKDDIGNWIINNKALRVPPEDDTNESLVPAMSLDSVVIGYSPPDDVRVLNSLSFASDLSEQDINDIVIILEHRLLFLFIPERQPLFIYLEGLPIHDYSIHSLLLQSDTLVAPQVATIYQGRLIVSGDKNFPGRVWCSEVGNVLNFIQNPNSFTPSDPFYFDILDFDSVDIQWMVAKDYIHIATETAEWTVRPFESIISQGNVYISRQSRFGNSNIAGILWDDTIISVDRSKKRIRAFGYNEQGFSSHELTALSRHLFSARIKKIVAANNPEHILYCLLEDKRTILTFTYNQQKNVAAWAEQKYLFDIHTIETVFLGNEDRLLLVIDNGILLSDLMYSDNFHIDSYTQFNSIAIMNGELEGTLYQSKFRVPIHEAVIRIGDNFFDGETLPISKKDQTLDDYTGHRVWGYKIESELGMLPIDFGYSFAGFTHLMQAAIRYKNTFCLTVHHDNYKSNIAVLQRGAHHVPRLLSGDKNIKLDISTHDDDYEDQSKERFIGGTSFEVSHTVPYQAYILGIALDFEGEDHP